jgi:hypothetical protein
MLPPLWLPDCSNLSRSYSAALPPFCRLEEIRSNKNLSWSSHEEVRLLERDGINKQVLMSRGAIDQIEWSGKNIMGDVVLEDNAWYVALRTPKEKKKPKTDCWVHLNAVLVDQCNELMWYILGFKRPIHL